MPGKEEISELTINRMIYFMRMTPEKGVNNVTLVGPVNVPTKFSRFIGLFPNILHPDRYGMATIDINDTHMSRTEIFDKVTNLGIPERVTQLHIPDDKDSRSKLEQHFASQGMPSILVAFGAATETKEEVVLLYLAWGISPEKALQQVKDKISARRASLQ